MAEQKKVEDKKVVENVDKEDEYGMMLDDDTNEDGEDLED